MAERSVQELFDKDDIRQQIFNYARALDRIDEELGKAVFHPEARLDYGSQIYQGSAWGFVEWCLEGHRHCVAHSHRMGNVSIWLDNDSRARSETYGHVTVRMRNEDGSMSDIWNLVRYIDRWEKRDGTWRITERLCLHDLDDTVPVMASRFEITGRRDKSDASYFPMITAH